MSDMSDSERPRTRGECVDGPRPCPWVSCRYHLYLEVNRETGKIKLTFPGLEPHQMAETCALDAADRGPLTLDEVGTMLNLTRERVRQLGDHAVWRLGRAVDRSLMAEQAVQQNEGATTT